MLRFKSQLSTAAAAASIVLVLLFCAQTPTHPLLAARTTTATTDTNDTGRGAYAKKAETAETAWQDGDVVPGEYIVQYHAPPGGLFARSHDDLVGALESRGVRATVASRFDDEDFHAAVVRIALDGDADADTDTDADAHAEHMRSLPHVKNVETVHVQTMHAMAGLHDTPDDNDDTDYDYDNTHANASIPTWTGLAVEARQEPSEPGPVPQVHMEPNAIHILTGVQAAHERGVVGQGTTVYLLSDGLDTTHPALQAEGKVVRAVDFVGDNMAGPIATNRMDPWGTCSNFAGTQIAGLAAGADPEMPMYGVAPHAKLFVSRIYDCNGRTTPVILLEALRDAKERGAKIVLLHGTVESRAVADMIRSMQDALVVVPTLESMYAQLFSSNNAVSSLPNVVSVAPARTDVSTYNLYPALWRAAEEESDDAIQTVLLRRNASDAMDGVFVINTVLADATSAQLCTREGLEILAELPDFDDRGIMILPSLPCIHTRTVTEFLKSKNIDRVIFHTADFDEPHHSTTPNYQDLAFRAYMNSADVATWRQLGDDAVIIIALDPVQDEPPTPATFRRPGARLRMVWGSTYGPAIGTTGMSPMLSAPGHHVLAASTDPRQRYAPRSSSSLSAAYVVGCIALLHSGPYVLESQEIVRRLIGSAQPVYEPSGELTSLARQGAGIVNVLPCLDPQEDQEGHEYGQIAPMPLSLSPPFVAFGPVSSGRAIAQATLCNNGLPDDTVQLTVAKAPTVYGLDQYQEPPGESVKPIFETAPASAWPDIGMQAPGGGPVTVKQWECQPVEFFVQSAGLDGLDAARIPFFNGFLSIKNQAETVSVPYYGVAGDLGAVDPIIHSETFPVNGFKIAERRKKGAKKGSDKGLLKAVQTKDIGGFYIVGLDFEDRPDLQKLPTLRMQLRYPPAFVEVTVVTDTDTGAGGYKTVATLLEAMGKSLTELRLAPIVWNGRLPSGELADERYYKFVVRALKYGGDMKNPADFYVYQSVAFGLKHSAIGLTTLTVWNPVRRA